MDGKKDNVNEFNEDELLKKIEKAVDKGVSKGVWKNGLISALPVVLILVLFSGIVLPKVQGFSEAFNSLFHREGDVADHDLTLDNKGMFGYTAADFEEAILGDSSKLKKIEVFTQEVSDVTTITDTGIFNWSATTVTKMLTYNGYAIYTVDLSQMKQSDIKYNEEDNSVTIYIPHAVQGEINIPEDRIQFGDTEKGILAFRELTLTPEQTAEVQKNARAKMQQKLEEDKVQETADRFAKLVIWELYQPIIKGVGKDCSLFVEFK